MARIKINDHDNAVLIDKVKTYFAAELDHEIGQFEAQFLIDFFIQELGPRIYNTGLLDAQAVMAGRLEMITEAISELEQTVPVIT